MNGYVRKLTRTLNTASKDDDIVNVIEIFQTQMANFEEALVLQPIGKFTQNGKVEGTGKIHFRNSS